MSTTLLGKKVGAASANVDAQGIKTVNIVYLVEATNDVSTDDVLATTGLPEDGDALTSDANCILSTKSARQTSKYHWEVTATYKTLTPGEWWTGEPGEWVDPFNSAPQYEFDTIAYDEEAHKDINGQVICNSAGHPFERPIVIRKTAVVCRITICQPTFDIQLARDYGGTVNSDPWNTIPAGQVLCDGIRGVREYMLPWTFWRVTYTFIVKADWKEHRLDEGPFWRETNGAVKWTHALDGTDKSTELKLLNGTGGPLTAQQIANGDRIYLDFDVRESKMFAGVLPK